MPSQHTVYYLKSKEGLHYGFLVADSAFELFKNGDSARGGEIFYVKKSWNGKQMERWNWKYMGTTTCSVPEVERAAARLIQDFKTYNIAKRNCRDFALLLIQGILYQREAAVESYGGRYG